MRHLPHSVDYTNAEDIIGELDNLSFEEIKQIMRDIIEDNSNLLKISERAAIALDQYKELVSLVDGIIIDDVMDSEMDLKEKAQNSIAEIFLRLIFSMKNTSYWLMILSDLMEKYASKDKGIHNLIIILKEMSKGILSASRKLKYKHPTKRKKSFLRNLERPKEKNGGRKLDKKVATSSPVNVTENVDEENENTAQNDGEMMDEELDETIPVNKETQEEEDAQSEDEQAEAASDKEEDLSEAEAETEKLDEELEETATDPPEAATESNLNEGEESDNEGSEEEKKNEKTFGISYFKTENLFRNGVVESNKTYQSISKKRNKTSPNLLKYNVNKNSQSSDTSRTGFAENKNSDHQSDSSETVSKGSRRYRKKRAQSSREEDTNINGVEHSDNDDLESSPKRQRRSNSSSSKAATIESVSKGRRKSRRDSSNIDSETATKSSISYELPKRRGRRRKMDIMLQEIMDNKDREDYGIKYSCVHLSNVLDDPSVQHYSDVIQMTHRMKRENTKLKDKPKRSRDKAETDENSLGKETNETDVEWSVLDAVSDEDEKDNINDEESGEVNSDNGEQASESEADQEQAVEDNDQEQPDDEELDNSAETKQTDERCHSADQDESSNHSEPLSESKQCTESSSNHPSVSSHEESDSERKDHKSSSPTPSSHPVPSPEVFHTEDENDAEGESMKSDEEEGHRTPSSSSEPSKHGKKGPRTPPTPPMLCIPRGPRTPPTPPMFYIPRGPRTPPALSEVSEDDDKSNSSDH